MTPNESRTAKLQQPRVFTFSLALLSYPLHEAARSCWTHVLCTTRMLVACTAGSGQGPARTHKTTNAPPPGRKAVEKGGRNTEIKLMIPCANGRSIERVDATSTTGARGALHCMRDLRVHVNSHAGMRMLRSKERESERGSATQSEQGEIASAHRIRESADIRREIRERAGTPHMRGARHIATWQHVRTTYLAPAQRLRGVAIGPFRSRARARTNARKTREDLRAPRIPTHDCVDARAWGYVGSNRAQNKRTPIARQTRRRARAVPAARCWVCHRAAPLLLK